MSNFTGSQSDSPLLLTGKRLLITGVVNSDSIAFASAQAAQRAGAEIVLAVLPRDLERAQEARAELDHPVEMIEMDITNADDVEAMRSWISKEWGELDGALHAIAFAPRQALSGAMREATIEQAAKAFETSTFSYVTLASVLEDLAPAAGGSLVGLDFHASAAWPLYNWMGVCKAALEATSRYVARDLGGRKIRSNLVAAGPLATRAASGIPEFAHLVEAWEERAAITWDPADASPVGEVVAFLFSDASRMISGEVLHVDGGFHAMASGTDPKEIVPGA